ncbi:MAG: chloride channel protein, partial [Bdellovibrionales bacterium]|nr:chloride channel protein [Bdellovibrionales bacterium]
VKSLFKEITHDAGKTIEQWSNRDLLQARIVLWTGAIVVGVVSAAFAVVCHWASDWNRDLVEGRSWMPFVLLPLGFLGIRIVTKVVAPAAPGSGIPQAIAALEAKSPGVKGQLLSFPTAIAKFALTAIGHLVGASIGREGPTVHIGSSLLYQMGRFAKFHKTEIEKGLIVAGGAAGISAAFNTPLAGIVFAIEELARRFEERISYVTLVTVVIAALVSMLLLGDYSHFGTSVVTVPWEDAAKLAVVVGAAGGILGGLFSKLLLFFRSIIAQYNYKNTLWVTALCGLIVAATGYFSNGFALGTGYTQTFSILAGETTDLPSHVPFLKMAATLASYLSGIPGGIFAPALATGASIGQVMSQSFLDLVGPAAAILGMAAYLTGVVQTPITSFVIVAEMVNDQSMIVPLMISSIVSLVFSKMVCPQPFYKTLSLIYLHRYEPPEPKPEESKKETAKPMVPPPN